ncbi:MAG: hypothetical protein AAB431_01465 [Patescibacteria group bacterium]
MTHAKKSFLAVTAVSLIGAAVLGVNATFAATPNTQPVDRMHTLVQALAEKFHLNTSEVQAVFEAQHLQHVADRETHEKELFGKLVTDGKLTQEQADKISAKQAETKTFMESLKGKTKAEVQTAMKAHMEEMKKWASDNNIPQGFLHRGFGPNMKRGFGHMGGFHR